MHQTHTKTSFQNVALFIFKGIASQQQKPEFPGQIIKH